MGEEETESVSQDLRSRIARSSARNLSQCRGTTGVRCHARPRGGKQINAAIIANPEPKGLKITCVGNGAIHCFRAVRF